MRRTAIRTAWASWAGLGLLAAGPARAQDARVELGASAGWTLGDGVTFGGVIGGDGNVYDEIGPKDSFCYSLNLGFFVNPQVEVGYVAYHFGDPEAVARFYVLGGAGATSYGSVAFQVGGSTAETSGETQFSTTWGAGVKLYPSPRFGVRLGARWTPTYVKSDAAGWWCDPYWGCYVASDAQYSNQFEFTGGAVVRF